MGFSSDLIQWCFSPGRAGIPLDSTSSRPPKIRTAPHLLFYANIQVEDRAGQGERNGGGFLDGDKVMFSGTELIARLSSKFPPGCKSPGRRRLSPRSPSPRLLMDLLGAMHQHDITDYNLETLGAL